MKAWIEITQWREFGDDNDSLEFTALDSTEVCVPCLIAEEWDLVYNPRDDGDKNTLIIVDSFTVEDGDEYVAPSGKKYRIRIEEVIE